MPYLRGLAYWRDRRLYTQSELAKQAGMRVADIRRFELGEQQARAETIQRLATILGVPPEALVNDPPAGRQTAGAGRLAVLPSARTEYQISYRESLNPGSDYLRVGIDTDRGEVTRFRIQYEVEIAGRVYPVVRCDCAHGYAHCDILDPSGRQIDKVPFPEHLSYKQALRRAMEDLKTNWPTYRDAFLERWQ